METVPDTMRLFFLVVFLLFHIGRGQINVSGWASQEILNNLYGNLTDGYQKNIRPDSKLQPTFVNTKLLLISMSGLDEPSGTLSVVARIRMSWTDDRMVWNASDYADIQEIVVPDDIVWVPKLMLANPVRKLYVASLETHTVRYRNDGAAEMEIAEFLETACDIDVTHFPFDRQVCSINFVTTSGSFGREVELHVSDNTINLDLYSPHGVWNMYNTHATDLTVYGNYLGVKYEVYLERNAAFVVINLFFPVIILVFLNCIVFQLPADSGERIGYSLTCLLALAVYLTLVSDSLPKLSTPLPVLSIILLLCLMESTAICLMVIGSLKLHLKDSSKPVPEKLKRFAQILSCKKSACNRKDKVNSVIEIREIKVIEATIPTRGKKERKKTTKPEKVTKGTEKKALPPLNNDDEDDKMTWKEFAKIYDNFCFIFILCCTAAMGIFYLMIVGGRL